MTIRQQQPVSPPRPEDRESLDDYASITQDNFRQLFQIAHRHGVRTTAPSSNEGNVEDIILVETSTEKYIAVKFSSGWFRTAALTAI